MVLARLDSLIFFFLKKKIFFIFFDFWTPIPLNKKNGLMFKKYRFPLNLFLIFENVQPVIYTSNCLTSNHYLIVIPNIWNYCFYKLIKNELFFSSSTLIEYSSIDTKQYKNLDSDLILSSKKGGIITFSTLYFYSLKIRITFLDCFNKKNTFNSIESIYNNANWLEKENSEMFATKYTNKRDLRNLLLDYSRTDYPLLKEFPCEGYYDVYFDFFEDSLKYITNELIEL